MPTIESITGDKLTAFAPTTTGVLYGKGKHVEIIKQMFDLGQLFEKITDFEVVVQSFNQNVIKELAYRSLDSSKTSADVLADIWQTCLDIIKCYDEKEKQNPILQELKAGISAFGTWTISSFRKENAFEIAGKIAYMVAKMIKKDFSPLNRYDPISMKISDYLIQQQDFNFLNKKVKYSNHALFYWYQAINSYSPLQT